jgi:hypothetical protein
VLRFHLKVSFARRVKAGFSAQHIDSYSDTGRPPSATPLGSGSQQSYRVLRWPCGIGLFHRLSFWSFVLNRMIVASSLAPNESAISTCNLTATTTMSEDVRGYGQSYISGQFPGSSLRAHDTYPVDNWNNISSKFKGVKLTTQHTACC